MKLKQLTFCVFLGLSTQQVAASNEGIYDYVVGGGNPIMGSSNRAAFEPNAGIAWNNTMSCTDFSLDHSLKSGFDTGQIKQLQASAIGLLKDTFNPVGLIGTAIRRADPGLYETIMNGVEQIKGDFNLGLASCEEAQESILDQVMGGDGKKMARAERWSLNSKKAENGGSFDIITESSMKGLGDEGISIGNDKKGGVGQPPIQSVKETIKYGFDALSGKDSGGGGGGGIFGSFGALSLSMMSAQALNGDTQTEPVKIFENEAQAEQFVVEVIGESIIRTCEGCPPIQAIPGRGIKNMLDNERTKLYDEIKKAIEIKTNTLKNSDLKHLSAHDSVIVNKEVIIALKKMSNEIREGYISSLASDIALARISNRLIFVRQVLSIGRHASELTAIEAIQDDMKMKISKIDDELDLLEREIRIKRFMSRNAAVAILERERALRKGLSIDTGKIL